MSTVRFELRADKADKQGKAPIRILYQIKGQRKTYLTPLKVYPANWDIETQNATYADKKSAKTKAPGIKFENLLSEREVSSFNLKLAEYQTQIENIETRLRLDGLEITPEKVVSKLKDFYSGTESKDMPGVVVADFIDKFIKESTHHKEGTLKEYKSLANHLRAFEKAHREKITFEGDASTLSRLSVFLSKPKTVDGKVTHPINDVTKAKLINTFKTALRHAKRAPYHIKVNSDYLEFKTRREDGEFEVIALTDEELQALIDLDLSNDVPSDRARDIYIFSAATSLRYSDLARLRWEHIGRDHMIRMAADKNHKKIEIPLNPISYAILQKYKGQPTPLPISKTTGKMLSDQKLNDRIKKVGELAGINTPIEITRPYGGKLVSLGVFPKYELLSIHTGRKSFITLSLEKGVNIQDVMAISTHSSYKVVRRYIDVRAKVKRAAMVKAWGELKEAELKAV